MELSFELIREAGLRVPGPIGPTRHHRSADTGAGSGRGEYREPDTYHNSGGNRHRFVCYPELFTGIFNMIMRFIFIFLGVRQDSRNNRCFAISCWSVALKSFGVPFMAPLSQNFRQVQ